MSDAERMALAEIAAAVKAVRQVANDTELHAFELSRELQSLVLGGYIDAKLGEDHLYRITLTEKGRQAVAS
jgi:hypothetical protein